MRRRPLVGAILLAATWACTPARTRVDPPTDETQRPDTAVHTADTAPPAIGTLHIENGTDECITYVEICEPLGPCDLAIFAGAPYCSFAPGEVDERTLEAGTCLLVAWDEAVYGCLVTQEGVVADRTTVWTVTGFYPCPEGIR